MHLFSGQSRLRGGAEWIRNLGTGLHWRKSRRLRKLQGLNLLPVENGGVVLRHSGKSVRFAVRSKGEWLCDSVAEKWSLQRPTSCQIGSAHDCVPAAQSESEKYLRRMCLSKGEWLATFGDSCPVIRFNRRQAPTSYDATYGSQ